MVLIDGHHLTLDELIEVARFKGKVEIKNEAKEKINKSREILETLKQSDKAIYGVNTGFGKLASVKIEEENISLLQENLLISHAVGAGDALDEEIVRAMLLLRANSLCQGFSGIRLFVIEKLLELLNKDIIPFVPSKGSLGASGDLAPLAHMALPLIGRGKCLKNGKVVPSNEVLKEKNFESITLEAKEGLALINGTQCMTAIGATLLYDIKKLFLSFNAISSLTLEALGGIIDAYDERISQVRMHDGQIKTGKLLRQILEGSKMVTRQGEVRVQDGYSLRCALQVHGAILDVINYAINKVNIEMNSATDNPLIFDSFEAISGGNFHGEVMALTFDFLGMAVAEMADISERRIERLVNPYLSNLPAFLSFNSGVNSGFMIVQYAAASLVSENKVLAHPASVDSIPSSAGQEDHVSMGTIAARKLIDIYKNTRRVIAMELLCASQALEFKEMINLSFVTRKIYDLVRKDVSKAVVDREFYDDIEKIEKLLKNEEISKIIEDIKGCEIYE